MSTLAFESEYYVDEITGAVASFSREITARYDHAYVARYEKYPEKELSRIRAELFHRFFPKADSVCDIGYGTGSFLRAVREIKPGISCHGFDVSPYPAPDFVKLEPGDPRFLPMLASRAHEHGFSTELQEDDEGA